MQKVFISFFIILFLSACSSTPVIKKPMLWRVENKGKVMHLFGTVHKGIDIKQVPQTVMQLLDKAEAVALEASVKDLEKFLKEFENKNNRSSKAYLQYAKKYKAELLLNKKRFKYLVDMMYQKDYGDYQEYYSDLSKVKPSQLYSMMLDSREYKKRNKEIYDRWQNDFSGDDDDIRKANWIYRDYFKNETYKNSLDYQIGFKASKNKKNITSLDQETAVMLLLLDAYKLASRIDYISGYYHAKEMQVKFVENMFAFERMQQAYLNGDKKALRSMLFKFEKFAHELILKDRNIKWLPEMEKILHKYNRSFVAVGAAHLLVGKDNLLKLMQKKGYKVTEINFVEK